MAQRSLYVLFDANIIVEAHMQSVWASLVQHVTVVVPSIVVQEARFYIDPETHNQIPIHLDQTIQTGEVQTIQATPTQLAFLMNRFDPVFIQRMDRGEAEALALLLAGQLTDAKFCTADGPAIRALSLLLMSDVGISLESLLRQIGFTHKLRNHFTDQFF